MPSGDDTEIRWSGRFTASRVTAGPLRALLRRAVRQFATAAAVRPRTDHHVRRMPGGWPSGGG